MEREELIKEIKKALEDELRSRTGPYVQPLQEAVTPWTENVQKFTRENPLSALGMAFAAGFVLSRLLSSGGKHE